jgi:hypothetical protein
MYFAPPHLAQTLTRAEALKHEVEEWDMTLPEVALRFILANPAVTTTSHWSRLVCRW